MTGVTALDRRPEKAATVVGEQDASGAATRSPVEPAIGVGRDPGWEELLELARHVGPAPEFAHLDDGAVERELRIGAARLAAATCRWLELLAELVVRGVWAEQGARTPAVWLSWAVGMAPATARDQVRVALRLRELPSVRASFAAGRISYSKARAITRVAVPELEDMLLEWADQATAAELEAAVRGFRRAQQARGCDADEVEARRGVWVVDHGDGTSDLVVRLPSDEARTALAHAQRLADLDLEAEDAPRHMRYADDDGPSVDEPRFADDEPSAHELSSTDERPFSDGSPPARSYGARVTEAVVNALASSVAAGPPDTSGDDRHTLVVHVADRDVAAAEDAPPIAVETSAGTVPAMSRRVLRRLACEAGIVFVGTGSDGTPVDVGRRDRRLSTALRRAVRARDRTCRYPGCGDRRHLHAHHVVHWADGGPTDLGNLVLLCGYHHRFVHAHDIRIRVCPAGGHQFRRATGARLPRSRPLTGAPDERSSAASGGVAMVGEGQHADATSREQWSDALQPSAWDGHFDLNATVAVLQQQFGMVVPWAALAA